MTTVDAVSVDCTVHYKIEDSYKAALNAGHMEEVRKLVMREARYRSHRRVAVALDAYFWWADPRWLQRCCNLLSATWSFCQRLFIFFGCLSISC